MEENKLAQVRAESERIQAIAEIAARVNREHPGARLLAEPSLVNHLVVHGHSIEDAARAFRELYDSGSWRCGSCRWEFGRRESEAFEPEPESAPEP